ncbi:T9SS type A sorting domain-containing protein [Spirosoma rigui]|uniref:T9SS type A sorting domain-containing protein n=1 Tax=Spirosoma rigui TaxID=564064 RepID=UPI0009AFCFF1|nr:T9SS type A sorting domain-containing protein [Spirosoma rigui]
MQPLCILPARPAHVAYFSCLLPALLLLWAGLITPLSAQTQRWPVTLGGTDKDSTTAMIATPDGGYIVAGSTASGNGAVTDYKGGKHDAWLVKLDRSGDVVWKKTLGGTGDDQATALAPSPDGGFVVTGISTSRDGDMADLDRSWPGGYDYIWVFKLNGVGEIVWKQAKGLDKGLYATAITAAPGGGYTLAGYYYFFITKSSGNFFYVLNLSEDGTINWDTYFGGRNGDDRLYALTATTDGGYVLAGKSSSPFLAFSYLPEPVDFVTNHNSYSTYDAFVIKLNHEGRRVWYRFLGGSGLDYANAITATPDGGFLMAGYTASTDGDVSINHGGGDAWLVKLTSAGAVSWQKTVGDSGPDNAYAVQPTTDGGYVVTGTSTANKAAVQFFADMWLFKVNSLGGVVWQRFFDRYGRNEGRAIATSPDGSYIVAGYTYLISGGLNGPRDNGDFVIAKFYPPQPLTITEPAYFCSERRILFGLSGGDGSPITATMPGVMRFSPQSLGGYVQDELLNNPRPILFTVTQNDQTVSYFFDFAGYYTRYCDHNPQRYRPLLMYPPTYDCLTGAITFNTTGGTGSPITYLAPGITRSSLSSHTGVVEQELRNDPKPIPISAMQDGVTVTYTVDLEALCSGRAPLVLLAPDYRCATGAIHFNTTGGDGSPVDFAAPGITGWTTNPDQFVDVESRTAGDVQPFTLMARQRGITVYYVWNLKMACGRARIGTAESARPTLQVTVLGNPVYGQSVDITIDGAAQRTVSISITDLRGRLVHQQTIGQAAAVERVSLPLPTSQGILVLTVSTADQRSQLTLLKP